MTEALIEELETLFRDYGIADRGRGRRYPKPVKSRIISILETGVSALELSRVTGISLTTLFSWRDNGPSENFEKIELRPSPQICTRLYIGEGAWIEIDLETLDSNLFKKIRASL